MVGIDRYCWVILLLKSHGDPRERTWAMHIMMLGGQCQF